MLKADVLHQFGTGLVSQGKLQEGVQILKRCLELVDQYPANSGLRNNNDQFGLRSAYEQTPLWETKAYTLNQLGLAAMYQGQFDLAKRRFDSCQEIFIAHHEEDNLACVAYQSMGQLLLYRGQAVQAIPLLSRGLNIRRRRRDQEGVAINALYLAAAYLASHQTENVEDLLNNALSIFRALGNHRSTGICYIYFGQYEFVCGNVESAFTQWQQALTSFATTPPPLIELRALIRYMPWMILHGRWQLVRQSVRQLILSKQQQELSIGMVIRLLLH